MKRIHYFSCIKAVATLLATACLLFFSGCRQSPKEPPKTSDFTCNITAQCGDLTVKGTLSRPTPAELTLTLSEPATLNGLTFHFNGTELAAEWHGLSIPLNREELPSTALTEGLITALESADTLTEHTVTEAGLVTEGTAKNHAFSLLSDPETGALRQLNIPSLDLYVTFGEK